MTYINNRRPNCSIDGCPRERVTNGYCLAHWKRLCRQQPMADPPLAPFPECGVEGCFKDATYNGGSLCSQHARQARSGVTPRQPVSETLVEKFQRLHVQVAGDACWPWIGVIGAGGYGRIKGWARGTLAHRLSWELTNGPIPEGLVVDHLCRNRACVRPSHMEIVAQAENVRRGAGPGQRLFTYKSRCKNGHEMTEENSYVPPSRPNERSCRACRRESAARARRQKSGAGS